MQLDVQNRSSTGSESHVSPSSYVRRAASADCEVVGCVSVNRGSQCAWRSSDVCADKNLTKPSHHRMCCGPGASYEVCNDIRGNTARTLTLFDRDSQDLVGPTEISLFQQLGARSRLVKSRGVYAITTECIVYRHKEQSKSVQRRNQSGEFTPLPALRGRLLYVFQQALHARRGCCRSCRRCRYCLANNRHARAR